MDRSGRRRGPQRGVALNIQRVRIIGPGRAGQSFARALEQHDLDVDLLGRDDAVGAAGDGVDVVLITTPDGAIAEVAAAIAATDAVVLHCSGATTLQPVAHHGRHGSIHPLMALPDPHTGAARLCADGWFGVAGDGAARALVELLGGKWFVVADSDRALYHATAAISANHSVALLAQVQRLSAQVGVPIEAMMTLVENSIVDVGSVGARAALTGPAARGDAETLAAHREILPDEELNLYNALAAACEALAEPLPDDS